MDNTRFVLASQSPRRRALLGLLDYPFDIVVPDVDEDIHLAAGPSLYVLRTARHKAEVAASRLHRTADVHALIVAADTTVALGDTIMGKPATADEARDMLVALRDRTHDVHTGLCVVDTATGREAAAVHTAVVTMRPYTPAEIDAYIATGDPMDKAGAYAIQHPVFRPVVGVEGCFLAVVGLSVCDLIARLVPLGVTIRTSARALEEAHQGFPCPVLESIRPYLR